MRTQQGSSGFSWLKLLGLVSTVELLLLILVGVLLQDTETLVFAAVVGAASVWFLIRPSVVPAVIRCLVFLDVFFFMAPAALANAAFHEDRLAILTPLALAVTSATGIAATVGYLVRRDDPDAPSRVATGVAASGVLALLIGLGATAAAASVDPQQAHTNDIKLSAQGAKFSTTTMRAAAGQVSVYISNDDLFWHTFTIKELGVNTSVPVKGHRRVTFTAARGRYEFHCAIPGHAAIGMKGTLTVR
jgi:plastocyanin